MAAPASLKIASLPRYNPADPEASFHKLYTRALEASDEVVTFYEGAAASFRRGAFILRMGAFALFLASVVLGGWALVLSEPSASVVWTRTSYLLAFLAAIVVGADRIFLVTQNRGRYTETTVKLRCRQSVFELAWAESMAKTPQPSPLAFSEAAAEAAAFLADMHSLVTTETLAWRADGEAAIHYVSRQLEIERDALTKDLDQLRASVEKAVTVAAQPSEEPGAVNIHINNAEQYKGGVKIKAGPYPEQTLPAGTGEYSFSSLKPGLITLTLTGIRTGSDRTTVSRTVTVKPGEITPVEL